jgi:hypothetical protein
LTIGVVSGGVVEGVKNELAPWLVAVECEWVFQEVWVICR